jgi:transcriptional regulator with XRE-family HTH domain
MSYRVTHLWSVLEKDERSLRWLARRTGYTHQYLSLLKTERRTSVSDEFAQKVSDALRLPIETVFAPIGGDESQAAD